MTTYALGRYGNDRRVEPADDGYGYTITADNGWYRLVADQTVWRLLRDRTIPAGADRDAETLLYPILGEPQPRGAR